MKLTVLVALLVWLHVPAPCCAQTVSFSGKNVSLQTVFSSVEQQTGLSFFYSNPLIDTGQPVTIDLRDVPMKTLLDSVLHPRGLDYYQKGKTIFVSKLELAPIDVSGKVMNEQGGALAGASVMVRNTTKGTLTKEDGRFTIKDVALGAILVVSFIGFQKEEYTVDGKMIKAILKLPASQLDEVRVIPYGNTTQRLSTGNTGTVESDEIERQPVNNPMLALEGQVPGLFIVPSSGLPGTGMKVRIQGQNSIFNGNDPLYAIDGVPYNSQLLATTIGGPLGASGGPAGASASGNPLNYINPDDIERISVFKDADATAIYGSRGANGVIFISTKQGKPGNAKVAIDVQQGLGDVTRWFPMMNTPQYLEMRNEALKNDGIGGPRPSDYDLNSVWDTTRYTNWQKALLGGAAQYSNAHASVSGGDSSTHYLVAGTYHRETTVFPGSFSDAKGSLYVNLGTSSANRRFSLHLMAGYLYDNDLLPAIDLTSIVFGLAPDAPAIHHPDGTLNWQLLPSGASTWSNPLANIYKTYSNRTSNLMGNLVLGYTTPVGLDFKLNLGYINLHTNEFSANPLAAYAPGQDPSIRGATYSNNSSGSWIVEPNLNYQLLTPFGTFMLLLGFTVEQNSSNGWLLSASGFNSDSQLADITAATTITPVSTVQSLYKYTGAFSRITYSYKDKYLLNGTVRRDGSSRFGPDNAYHNFIAVGAAWVFSDEKLVKDRLRFLSYGKVRGSYGTTGNDQIGDYQYMELYVPVNTGVPYQNTTGLTLSNLTNPGIRWELTKKLQTGIDLGFLHDRLLLTADVVINKSSNELINVNIPIITGFSTIPANVPATVKNTGLEFGLNTINIRNSQFSWTSSINFSIPHNRLLRYIGTPPENLAVGQPLGIVKAYNFAGVDPATGVYQFRDSKGDVTIAPNAVTDYTKFVNTAFPICYGGLKNTLTYKRFECSVFLQVVRAVGANGRLGSFPGPGFAEIGEPTTVLGRWQKPGQTTTIERYNSDGSLIGSYTNAEQSTAAYSNASYIRIKNLSVSYRLSADRAHRLHCKSLQIYVHAENLFTFTRYAGLDPETGNAALPPLRKLILGMHLEL
jgi:TonB-dependent starch-binding outer membrane protein SusC